MGGVSDRRSGDERATGEMAWDNRIGVEWEVGRRVLSHRNRCYHAMAV